MALDSEIKQQVREFYDQVGWQEASDGFYQNASYEDLRPVAHDYIHKCHLRVCRHLAQSGRFILDAGSGPIQYPEYLEYSKGYQRRVCADISLVALQEARKRISEHGLFVVCDVARLPFISNVFDGLVSLHTLHHLPVDEQNRAYLEFYRTMAPLAQAVVVNGAKDPPISAFFNFWINITERLRATKKQTGRSIHLQEPGATYGESKARGTYVSKHKVNWLQRVVGSQLPVEIWCWRSVSVRFLRTFIHERLAGRSLLRFIYWLEECFPHFFGKYGQYPMVVLMKGKFDKA